MLSPGASSALPSSATCCWRSISPLLATSTAPEDSRRWCSARQGAPRAARRSCSGTRQPALDSAATRCRDRAAKYGDLDAFAKKPSPRDAERIAGWCLRVVGSSGDWHASRESLRLANRRVFAVLSARLEETVYDDELELLGEADRRAADYLRGIDRRAVFPGDKARAALRGFEEPLPPHPSDPAETLRLLDELGSPATTATNGPRYFGFVIGATLPAAAAAERLTAAWDQCASSYINSPAAATIESVAGRWLLEILDLPAESAVGFGTSATACGLACLAAARRALLGRQGWDFDGDGLAGAPEVRVVISETGHITMRRALRVLGFGERRLIDAPTDDFGRVDPARLPELDDRTILCLQAGEVNTGEFDPFLPLVEAAKEAGTWVHVDGAFGLWARASEATRRLAEGVGGADSWTTDGHKWLNTPYDGAVAICRDAAALSDTLQSDAVYLTAEPRAQKNLTLEFSRRARGVPIWAALRSLGREGVGEMVERHCRQARRLARGLAERGVVILNRVVLNQVLATLPDDGDVAGFLERVQDGGKIWFGASKWNGKPVFRLSVSSWRTTDDDIELAIEEIARAWRSG
ncbi:MAG: aspartate aminotransferase family protein [bacterium]|nr:aspartate aminotransferase family protein [bacterium]